MNIVLMAGGGGTRLWPLSRQHNPKQFIDLGTGKTLLEHTYERARALVPEESIYVATLEAYGERVRVLLPRVPAENMFYEPQRRETAPAFAAMAVQLTLRGQGEEPTIFMWSDHVFTAEEEFLADMAKIPGLLQAHPDHVVIVGHRPTFPETGLGYFEVGAAVAGYDDVFRVKAFKEKPDAATAEMYLAAGTYFWNMAYVSTRPAYLLQELTAQAPELMRGVEDFTKAVRAGDTAGAAECYARLPKISIDYALLEKTPRILAVTGDYGWSDVGNWAAVHDVFGIRGDHVPHGHHLHVSSDRNYVYNATKSVVSLIGMHDTVVVVTDDAILITKKDHAHQVKDVVSGLEAAGKSEYL